MLVIRAEVAGCAYGLVSNGSSAIVDPRGVVRKRSDNLEARIGRLKRLPVTDGIQRGGGAL